MRRLPFMSLALLAVLPWGPPRARALPAERSATATEDDASVEVVVLERFIAGDTRSKCTVSIDVGASAVAFTADDAVYVWVYEDDLVGDDEIWQTSFTVSAEEISAGRVQRSFDCTGVFEVDGEDLGNNVEIYAQARVEKDACGLLCLYDRPETSTIEVLRVIDDGREEDDGAATPFDGADLSATDLIARDEDWTRIDLSGQGGDVTVELRFDANTGPLDLTLSTGGGGNVATGADEAGGARLSAPGLAAGDYVLRVSPRDGADPNFYDLTVDLNGNGGGGGGCTNGMEDTEPCGNCGVRRRTCLDGVWGAFSDCQGQGPCGPGSTESAPCGNCGVRTRVCTEFCTWQEGDCSDQRGECVPGDTVTEPCAGGGTRMRACNEGCMWSDVTSCEGEGGVDGGRPPPPPDAPQVGCCSVSGSEHGPLPLLLALGLAALLVYRRRRRPSTEEA